MRSQSLGKWSPSSWTRKRKFLKKKRLPTSLGIQRYSLGHLLYLSPAFRSASLGVQCGAGKLNMKPKRLVGFMFNLIVFLVFSCMARLRMTRNLWYLIEHFTVDGSETCLKWCRLVSSVEFSFESPVLLQTKNGEKKYEENCSKKNVSILRFVTIPFFDSQPPTANASNSQRLDHGFPGTTYKVRVHKHRRGILDDSVKIWKKKS